MTVPPRVLYIMIVTASRSPCYMQGKLFPYSMMPRPSGSQPVFRQAKHSSYLVQVIGGGQYRCAYDHIHEWHPDAVKPDRSTITDVAPATPECSPGIPPVRPAPAAPVAAPVAQATTPPSLVAPATTQHIPRKSVVHTPL